MVAFSGGKIDLGLHKGVRMIKSTCYPPPTGERARF